MRKHILNIVFILMLVLGISFVMPSTASASSEETVFDYADLLTTAEEKELREYSEKYEEYNISVIFLTISDAEGKSSMVYSDDFYDTHAFLPDGVLFMIDMDNREIYINTVGACIEWLEDDIDPILDDTYMYASDGEYYNCLLKMCEKSCVIIEDYKKPVSGAIRPSPDVFVPALLIAVVVLIVLLVRHNKANHRILAERYLESSLVVNDKDVTYMGCRDEVIRGYYAKKNSGGSKGSGGRTHISSRGISHGGGGRKF